MRSKQVLEELFLMQQAYATLFCVINKLQEHGDGRLGSLTSRQLMLLMAVLHLPPDQTSFINVARKLGTSKQNAAKLIASLEKSGFLARVASPRDARAANLRITESGKAAIIEGNRKGLLFLADAFSEFSREELQVLWASLKKLYAYDGQALDGYEEPVSAEWGVEDPSAQELLEEFARRRISPRRKRMPR